MPLRADAKVPHLGAEVVRRKRQLEARGAGQSGIPAEQILAHRQRGQCGAFRRDLDSGRQHRFAFEQRDRHVQRRAIRRHALHRSRDTPVDIKRHITHDAHECREFIARHQALASSTVVTRRCSAHPCQFQRPRRQTPFHHTGGGPAVGRDADRAWRLWKRQLHGVNGSHTAAQTYVVRTRPQRQPDQTIAGTTHRQARRAVHTDAVNLPSIACLRNLYGNGGQRTDAHLHIEPLARSIDASRHDCDASGRALRGCSEPRAQLVE